MSAPSSFHISAERSLPASRETVWNTLQDPEVLQACIPKCEAISRVGDEKYDLLFSARFGPARISLKGNMRLSDLRPFESYRLHFDGEAFASRGGGAAFVQLVESGSATVVRYDLEVFIDGRIGKLGTPIIRGAVERGLDKFFADFENRVVSLK